MNHTIIGTAGHVDHGKTSLIKALTGISGDRLQEEKKRGITIELGFASMDIGGGEKLGIIDVPGHEKFIGNMLSGAGGIDIVLLVIAADEGFMPQTREHLNIMTLLGIKNGIVVLSKIDTVEEDWLELVHEEVKESLAGSFLASAPIVPVSSTSGEGIGKLRELIISEVKNLEAKNCAGSFRLPVDRLFSKDGFGTVVTGTLIEGKVAKGDEIMIYPNELSAKVRSLQVHGESVDSAAAGQRVAMNIAGIKKSDLQRGDVLASPHSLQSSHLLDVRLDIVESCDYKLFNQSRLHFYHGSSEQLCKLVLLEQDFLESGDSAYAQLRLEKPITAKRGDRFVLRFYSPLKTIGGGIILDPLSGRRRRNDDFAIEGFKIKDGVELAPLVERFVLEYSASFRPFSSLAKLMFMDLDPLPEVLNSLIADGKIYRLANDTYIHDDYLAKLWLRIEALLAGYHKENPLHSGLRRDALRTKLLPSVEQSTIDNLLDILLKKGKLKILDSKVALSDFSITMSDEHLKQVENIEKRYLDAGFSYPSVEELLIDFTGNKTVFLQSLESLAAGGVLVVLDSSNFIHIDYFNKALDMLKELRKSKKSFTLAEFRDMIGSSRKYAVMLLEYMDLNKITTKQEDARILL